MTKKEKKFQKDCEMLSNIFRKAGDENLMLFISSLSTVGSELPEGDTISVPLPNCKHMAVFQKQGDDMKFISLESTPTHIMIMGEDLTKQYGYGKAFLVAKR